MQWVTNSYLLALAAALIFGGKLGDCFGRRTFYLIDVAGFTLASVAIGLSGSIEGVIAFRALQGFFGALLMPSTLGMLRAVFPPKKFGMAVGIWAMVSSVSTALGPIVGGLLVEHVNWESVFYINAPIGILAIAVSVAVLPQSRNDAAAEGGSTSPASSCRPSASSPSSSVSSRPRHGAGFRAAPWAPSVRAC